MVALRKEKKEGDKFQGGYYNTIYEHILYFRRKACLVVPVWSIPRPFFLFPRILKSPFSFKKNQKFGYFLIYSCIDLARSFISFAIVFSSLFALFAYSGKWEPCTKRWDRHLLTNKYCTYSNGLSKEYLWRTRSHCAINFGDELPVWEQSWPVFVPMVGPHLFQK